MIVIDVGSKSYGGADSLSYLIEWYKPRVIFGFDPANDAWSSEQRGETLVILDPKAAWTYDGMVGFEADHQYGQVTQGGTPVSCFDLAAFVKATFNTSQHESLVLKLDCEGAEYVLIPHLRENGADELLTCCLVEWHCEFCGIGGNGRHRETCTGDHEAWQARREATEALLRCPRAEWNL